MLTFAPISKCCNAFVEEVTPRVRGFFLMMYLLLLRVPFDRFTISYYSPLTSITSSSFTLQGMPMSSLKLGWVF